MRAQVRARIVPGLPLLALGLIVGAAIGAPLLTPHDPVQTDLRSHLLPPAWIPGGSPEHFLGTDGLGRDSLARLLYGARISLSVALLGLLIAVFLGTLVGLVAGFVGGWVEALLMRIVDMVLALPTLLVALAVAVALGPSFTNLVLIIGLLIWPRIARLIRGETLGLKRQDFVGYPRAIGVPGPVIVARHILPNVLPTILVAATLEVGHIVLVEASLSFLGAGMPPPSASWGVVISDGRALIATGWWIALFAGLSIVVTVLSCNALGDWLRDRYDPKLREI